MSRPKSDEKRSAILTAAARMICAHGLSAPTAGIAKEAGVANGSLFVYFETKHELFDQLYLELKTEMAAAAMRGLPERAEPREQLLHLWRRWTGWAVRHPEKRRALAHLGASDELTPAARAAGHETMAGIAELLERIRAGGSAAATPPAFVFAMMNDLAETTVEFMTSHPGRARRYCIEGFDALWRIVA